MIKRIATSLILTFIAAFLAFGSVINAQNATPTRPTTTSAAALACMKAAVERRDNAIIAAFDAYSVSTKATLEARKNALLSAWNIAEKKERRAAIKAAWKTYKDSQKAAKDVFKQARKAAWTQFLTDTKACGKDVRGDDSMRQGVDEQL